MASERAGGRIPDWAFTPSAIARAQMALDAFAEAERNARETDLPERKIRATSLAHRA